MHRCISWDSLPEEAQDQQGYILSEDYNVFDGIVQWGRRMFTSPHDEVIWVNSCVVGTWLGWKPLATAIKPQEFDLPLAEGVSALGGWKNTYSKDQFGIVRVWFSVQFESVPGLNAPVFILPEGFRPDSICCNAATFSIVSQFHAILSVMPSGATQVNHETIEYAGPINLHGYIEFPAD